MPTRYYIVILLSWIFPLRLSFHVQFLFNHCHIFECRCDFWMDLKQIVMGIQKHWHLMILTLHSNARPYAHCSCAVTYLYDGCCNCRRLLNTKNVQTLITTGSFIPGIISVIFGKIISQKIQMDSLTPENNAKLYCAISIYKLRWTIKRRHIWRMCSMETPIEHARMVSWSHAGHAQHLIKDNSNPIHIQQSVFRIQFRKSKGFGCSSR